MLNKTLQLKIDFNYLAVTDDDQYCAVPKNVDVIKSLLSTGHFWSLSEKIYPVIYYKECL